MPPELISHLPQQWVGIFAIVAFIVYIAAQVVEKSDKIAKIVPFGRWWHKRQNRQGNRRAWIAEDNAVISGMQEQIQAVARDLAEVNDKVRVFTAWSVYDARYHHKIEMSHADGRCSCELPRHYDYFAFETLYRADPVAAAAL
ncbi:hypothetical protein M045_gp30 [Mycobacterium phage HINdeR]|uniref:Uncharacterized protein n=1 Tax=Mycobacterium phage HINdeR TaxID=1327770 RepID=R4JG94_9CAUD|nr:hypothetical protein M045_gp30 [Mycobacterium phage HINdeR]AGK87509.1 hypothetical protein PBI_HINDER_30 [Mycobacterium phage HINdeR]